MKCAGKWADLKSLYGVRNPGLRQTAHGLSHMRILAFSFHMYIFLT